MTSHDAAESAWLKAHGFDPEVKRLSKVPLSPESPLTNHFQLAYPERDISAHSLAPAPTIAANVPRECRLRLRVSDISSIDLPSRNFTISFVLEVHWDAPLDEHSLLPKRTRPHVVGLGKAIAVPGSGAVVGDEDTDLWGSMFPYRETGRGKSLWTPKLNFDNCLDLNSDADRTWQVFSGRKHESSGVPVVCFKLRGTGTFRARFELQRFPMDAQDLQCTVVSKRVSSELALVPHPSANHILPQDKFLLRDEFFLVQSLPAVSWLSDAEESSGGKRYPQIFFTIKVVRRPNYYWQVVYVPMFLFVLCSFFTILLEVQDFKERLGLLFTLWLAAIAHSNVFTHELPKVGSGVRIRILRNPPKSHLHPRPNPNYQVSYLTDLDKYVLGCNFVLVAIIFESVAQFSLEPHLSPENRYCVHLALFLETCVFTHASV